MKDTWHSTELKKFLKNTQQNELLDSNTVYLSNPEHRKEIDKIICDRIYSKAVRASKESPIRVTTGRDCDLIDCIEEEWKTTTTRSLTFLLEDPERPLVPSSVIKWYCRFKIVVSVTDYMIMSDFSLYYPAEFGADHFFGLLKDPAFHGVPPQLHYEQTIDEDEWLCLTFEKGYGKSRGLSDYGFASEQIYQDVQNNLEVIYRANELEVDFDNQETKERFRKALIKAYESN